MIRELRRSDGPRFIELMNQNFPEENALLGNRPQEFEKVIERAFRWDTRFLLGLLRLLGRPIVRVLVIEGDGHPVATTMLTFPAVASYVSNVVVDPAYRRRGYAKAMLEEARRNARRNHRRYVVLDVLETNSGARALYDSVGYRPLRARTQMVREAAASPGPSASSNAGIRPFRKTDADALAEVARRENPPKVEEVLPTGRSAFLGFRLANRIIASEERAWVVDRGRGPEGHVAATVSQVFEAAHLTAPVIAPSVEPELADALVGQAVGWLAEHRAPRMLSMVADDNVRGRSALERAGFRHAFALWTLYRPVD